MEKEIEEKITEYILNAPFGQLERSKQDVEFGYSLSQSAIQELCGVLKEIKDMEFNGEAFYPRCVELAKQALQKHKQV